MKHTTQRILIVAILTLSILTSACNARTDRSSEDSAGQPPSSAVSMQEAEPESTDDVAADEDVPIPPILYSVIKDYFFGAWTSETGDQLFIGYGDESDISVFNSLIDTHMDESGNAVMELFHGGEPYRYTVSSDEPDTLTVISVNGEPGGDAIYTKTAEAGEPTDVFGYMDILEYCIGGTDKESRNLTDPVDSPYSFFYYTLVSLNDGSRWERSATLGTPYPTLYLVGKSDDAITLRSLFYPEGTDPDDDSAASLAKEILFTISYEGSAWDIRSASLV